jgi:hypothetical protein
MEAEMLDLRSLPGDGAVGEVAAAMLAGYLGALSLT